MPIPAVFTAVGNRLIHAFGFKVIAEGFLPGERDGDLATVGQMRSDSQSYLYMQSTILPEGQTVTIPENYKAVAFGTYTNNGTIVNNGDLIIASDPA